MKAQKTLRPFSTPRLSAVERSGSPDDAITEFLKLIDGTSKGLPDLSKIPLDRDLIDVTPTEAPPEPRPSTGSPVPRLPS